ncbi:hypothetical protein LTR15_010299 [Elasticomyces elasticus]|nr:hypothetical protein LTR15_010299 [Elasticomyces elasticus]
MESKVGTAEPASTSSPSVETPTLAGGDDIQPECFAMAGEDDDKYVRYANIPIPSYDEATSSRPTSSQDLRGTQEINSEAERQGLLYQQPTVESARNSLDSDDEDDLHLPEVNGEDGDRRQVEELDYLDPSIPDTSRRSPRLYHRARLRGKWSQHLSSIGATLSSIRLPSFRSLYQPVGTDTTTQPDTRTWLSRTAQRVRVPERYRMSAPTAARLCGLFTLVVFIYFLFAMDLFPGGRRHRPFDPEAIRAFIQEKISGDNIRESLAHITSFDHVAGTEGDLYLAKWMQEKWSEEGGFDQLELLPYYVYLDYPGERRVSIVQPEAKRWTAALEEDQVYAERQQTKAWHGYSKSGEVEGHLVYANSGSREDFEWLQEHNVTTKGAVVLMKHGGDQPNAAFKIRAAEDAGCVGVLLYSDPSDVTKESQWQQPDDMVQRGSVGMSSNIMGDPLTPGYASTIDAPRASMDDNTAFVSVPSLPLSWRDAKILVSSLDKHGQKVPGTWVHGKQPDSPKDWYTGAIATSDAEAPIVHLKNLNDANPLQQIWNLHGMIEGLETPGKKIIVGNHRDAWCFGAVDPGSGSAVMMEVVRIFGELAKLGWRPLRTVEFVSWDASAYNFVGSTEYVEDHADYIRENGVAYVNVDSGVSGPLFQAAGSPVWQRALLHVLSWVEDPASNGTASLKQTWDEHSTQFDGLGADGDYVPFQHMAGTSSIDISFTKGLGQSEEYYPYHSCHETLEWMTEHGDPDFAYHTTLAQIWALLILELADRPMLPFDVKLYAEKLNTYIGQLERDVAGTYARLNSLAHASAGDVLRATNFTLQPLRDAVISLSSDAEAFYRFEDIWIANVLGSNLQETPQFALKRMEYNDRLALFETNLLDLEPNDGCPAGGLPGRCQYKHVVYGPQRESGYDVGYFPFIRDAVDAGDWKAAQAWVEKAGRKVREAGNKLLGTKNALLRSEAQLWPS